VRRARQKGGRAAGQLRSIEGRRRKLDTPAELIAFTSTVVQDVIAGTVLPDIARVALYGISIQKSLIETGDLAERLARIEAHQARTPQKGPGTWR